MLEAIMSAYKDLRIKKLQIHEAAKPVLTVPARKLPDSSGKNHKLSWSVMEKNSLITVCVFPLFFFSIIQQFQILTSSFTKWLISDQEVPCIHFGNKRNSRQRDLNSGSSIYEMFPLFATCHCFVVCDISVRKSYIFHYSYLICSCWDFAEMVQTSSLQNSREMTTEEAEKWLSHVVFLVFFLLFSPPTYLLILHIPPRNKHCPFLHTFPRSMHLHTPDLSAH